MCNKGSIFLDRIVYNIDTMVKEWYQGLLGKDVRGCPKVEYLVPCTHCVEEGLTPHVFTLAELIEASEKCDYVSCGQHRHMDGIVCIGDIAPDVLLRDFGEQLINETDIELNLSSSLGEGTQGAVCTGSFRGIKVAVKVFGGGSSSWADYEEQPHYQLRQECSILRLLAHPAIVKFIGVVLRPRCLVMELAGYGSLDKLIKSSRESLTRAFTHRVLLQVIEGLAYLHKHSIIYRDLKPQNVLIVSKDVGVPINAKLADFGISGLTTDEGLLIDYAGTVGFMDPNITGKQVYDNSVDIFSFGMLIREMLTGERVLSELNFPKQITGALLDGRAALARELGWYDMTQLLNQCVAVNPELRPSALQITDLMSRSDVLCLKHVYSPFERPDTSLREYIVLEKSGTERELWVKVSYSECHEGSRYGLAILSLGESAISQKTAIPFDDDFICLTSYLGMYVVVGGSAGKITVINTVNYRVEFSSEVRSKGAPNLSRYALNVLCMLTMEDVDLSYLVLGLGNGQVGEIASNFGSD